MSLGDVIRPQTRLLIYRWSRLSRTVVWHARSDLLFNGQEVPESLFFSRNPDLSWQPSIEGALMRHLGHPVWMSDRERSRFLQATYEQVIQSTYKGTLNVAEWYIDESVHDPIGLWVRGRLLVD